MGEITDLPWYFRVEPDPARRRRTGLQPRIRSRGARRAEWWRSSSRGPQRGSARASQWAGYGQFLLNHPRDQRVAVRTSVASHTHGGTWYKHGAYLQRHGAQRKGRGLGFDAHGNEVRMAVTLGGWQREGDPHLFKLILSPDHAEALPLQQWTRDVMHAIERDLGRPLQWMAIDHHNTTHPHVHVCVRGIDRDGQELRIAKDYLYGGLRARARDVLTQYLGWRLAPEWERSQERAVRYRGYGEHDQSLFWKLDDDRTVPAHVLSPYEQTRLRVLETRGLAWPTADGWQLAFQWKEKLKMEQDRERIERAPEHQRHERERPAHPKERERDAQQQEREEQERRQRNVRVYDEMEREWGR